MGKKKTKKAHYAFTVLFAIFTLFPPILLIWFPMPLIDHQLLIRMSLLFVAVLLLTALIALIFLKGEKRFLIVNFCFLTVLSSSLGLLFRAFDYSFEDFSDSPLWIIPAALGICVGAFTVIKWCDKSTKTLARLGYFLLCAFLVCMIIGLYAIHLNYALNFTPPQDYSATIEDKHWSKRRRNPTDDYTFKVSIDGKTYRFEVTRDEYYRYDEGDTYYFYRYEGALGEPFFLSKMGK